MFWLAPRIIPGRVARMEALVLHTIGLFVFVYFIFSVAASLVIGRAIRFASDDYAEHPILDQPGWSNADQRGAAWAADR